MPWFGAGFSAGGVLPQLLVLERYSPLKAAALQLNTIDQRRHHRCDVRTHTVLL